jgi:hypothetical protein
MARQGWFDSSYNKQGWFDQTRADPRNGWFDETAVGPSDGNQNVQPRGGEAKAPPAATPVWWRERLWKEEQERVAGDTTKKLEEAWQKKWEVEASWTTKKAENDNAVQGDVLHPVTGEVIFSRAPEGSGPDDVDRELSKRMWEAPLSTETLDMVAGPAPWRAVARPALWFLAGAGLAWFLLKKREQKLKASVAPSSARAK